MRSCPRLTYVVICSFILSNAAISTAQPLNAPAPRVKVFEWTDKIWAGDCRMLAKPMPTMKLYRDGHFEWQAYVWSRDTNDTWKGWMMFLDGNDRPVMEVSMGEFHMPRAAYNYRWQSTSAPNDVLAAYFPEIHGAKPRFEC